MTQIFQFKGTTIVGEEILTNGPAIKLGIQAPAGTQFKLNGNNSVIEVGSYGIYELDLSDLGQISSLIFLSKADVIVDAVIQGGSQQ